MHTPGHARTHAHSTPNKENYALHVLPRLPTFPQTFQESRGSLPSTSRAPFDHFAHVQSSTRDFRHIKALPVINQSHFQVSHVVTRVSAAACSRKQTRLQRLLILDQVPRPDAASYRGAA